MKDFTNLLFFNEVLIQVKWHTKVQLKEEGHESIAEMYSFMSDSVLTNDGKTYYLEALQATTTSPSHEVTSSECHAL